MPISLLTVIVSGIAAWAIGIGGASTPYPLDDTFIHLAIAKNLALGHWGITQHAFSNASTSPIYVGLLAALGKAGLPWIWLPFRCGHDCAKASAFLTPFHAMTGRGACQRSEPTGGAANGIPLKVDTPCSRFPATSPPVTVACKIAAAPDRIDRI